MALRLRAVGRLLGVSREAPAPALLAGGRRLASPQPVPEPEEAAPCPPLAEPQPQASTSGRQAEEAALRKRLLYILYKTRGEAIDRHLSDPSLKHGAIPPEEHEQLLLPLRLLSGEGSNSTGKIPAALVGKYYQELRIEMSALQQMQEKVVAAVDGTMKRGAGADLRAGQSLIGEWAPALTRAIANEQRAVLNSVKATDRLAIGPHLLLLPAHVMANAALHAVITGAMLSGEMGELRTSGPCLRIGKNVQQQVALDMMMAKAKRVTRQRQVLMRRLKTGEAALRSEGEEWTLEWFQRWSEKLQEDSEFRAMDEEVIRRELMRRLRELKPYELPDPAERDAAMPLGTSMVASLQRGGGGAESLDVVEGSLAALQQAMRRNAALPQWERLKRLNTFINRARRAAGNWDSSRIAKVGARLLDLMTQCCTVEVTDPFTGARKRVPAMWHRTVYIPADNRNQGFLYLHDEVVRRLGTAKDVKGLTLPAYQPMVMPPMPWSGVRFGGYMLTGTYLMRTRGFTEAQQALEEADRNGSLQQVYAGLNALGATAWRINKELLEVVREADARNLRISSLPLNEDLPIVPPPNSRRFRICNSGFWKYPEPEAPDEDLAAAERAAAADDAAAAAEGGATIREYLTRGEGTTLSPPARIHRGRFTTTQLLVTQTDKETYFERYQRHRENAAIRKLNRENFSLRCDLKYKLEVADRFKNEPALYFPHNLDFRGRAYPMHPHLNHLGDDVCRSLLEFSEGRPLGPDGLGWLYVQLANHWGQGVDKRSFQGRRAWAAEHLQEALASAREPLEHGWWRRAESPFQALAVCKELARALASGDPAAFVSHTPVAVDGSCNGLQHYAALGLDQPGGRAVNLLPVDQPQDVYMEVCEIVRAAVRKEAEAGSQLAAMLLGQVDRKLIKQTVMTSVYGVTYVGARQQIQARLKERGYQQHPSNRNFDAFRLASHAAKHVLDGLATRFSTAQSVMDWLAQSAKAVAATGEPMAWTTPLGLPVVQPYRQTEKLWVNTSLQRIVLNKTVPSKHKAAKRKQARPLRTREPILKARQRSAFPPNFVHSIDSTHMLLTAAACREAGLAFAGVHDSFWTHAADVPALNRVLREQFVALYQRPLLENLRDELLRRFPDAKIPPLTPKGSLDIRQVLDAEYFFS